MVEGDRIGPYLVEAELGRGGMGRVVRAQHPRLGISVAIKELTDLDPETLARFEREAEVLGRLSHPGIVRVHEFGHSRAGRPYLVLELCEGADLKERLREVGHFEPQVAAELVIAIANAVQAAHQAGVVHRDLKPANVLLIDGCPKVTDFGLARTSAGGSLTGTGVVMGTPAYMSPEQIEDPRQADARSDVYSLGVILYELLSGRTPWIAPTPLALLNQVLHEAPAPLPRELPAPLRAVVAGAMSRDPGERFPSAAAFRAALEAACARAEPRSSRSRVWLGLALGAGLTGLIGAALIGAQAPAPSPVAPSRAEPSPEAPSAPAGQSELERWKALAARLASLDDAPALAELEGFQASDPAVEGARELARLERLARLTRYEEALALGRRLLGGGGRSPAEEVRLLLELVGVCDRLEFYGPRSADARAWGARAVELSAPDSPLGLAARALEVSRRGPVELEELRRAAGAFSGHPAGLARFAGLLISKGQFEEGERALELLEGIEPFSGRSLGLRAYLLGAQQRWDELGRLLDLACERGRLDPQVIAPQLRILARRGARPEALALAQRCLRAGLEWPPVHALLALEAARSRSREASARARALVFSCTPAQAESYLKGLGADEEERVQVAASGLALPLPAAEAELSPEWAETVAALGEIGPEFAEALRATLRGAEGDALEDLLVKAARGPHLLELLVAAGRLGLARRDSERVERVTRALRLAGGESERWRDYFALRSKGRVPPQRYEELLQRATSRALQDHLRAYLANLQTSPEALEVLRELSARSCWAGAICALREANEHASSQSWLARVDRELARSGALHMDLVVTRTARALAWIHSSGASSELLEQVARSSLACFPRSPGNLRRLIAYRSQRSVEPTWELVAAAEALRRFGPLPAIYLARAGLHLKSAREGAAEAALLDVKSALAVDFRSRELLRGTALETALRRRFPDELEALLPTKR